MESVYPYSLERISINIWKIVENDRFGQFPFCYVILGRDKCVIIDTGCGTGEFKTYVDKCVNKSRLPYVIISTHVHFDHVGSNHQFYEKKDTKDICMGGNDKVFTKNLEINSLSLAHGVEIKKFEVSKWLNHGDRIYLDDNNKTISESLEVIFTPGHTIDSIALFYPGDKRIFVGDTIYPFSGVHCDCLGSSLVSYVDTLKLLNNFVLQQNIVYNEDDNNNDNDNDNDNNKKYDISLDSLVEKYNFVQKLIHEDDPNNQNENQNENDDNSNVVDKFHNDNNNNNYDDKDISEEEYEEEYDGPLDIDEDNNNTECDKIVDSNVGIENNHGTKENASSNIINTEDDPENKENDSNLNDDDDDNVENNSSEDNDSNNNNNIDDPDKMLNSLLNLQKEETSKAFLEMVGLSRYLASTMFDVEAFLGMFDWNMELAVQIYLENPNQVGVLAPPKNQEEEREKQKKAFVPPKLEPFEVKDISERSIVFSCGHIEYNLDPSICETMLNLIKAVKSGILPPVAMDDEYGEYNLSNVTLLLKLKDLVKLDENNDN